MRKVPELDRHAWSAFDINSEALFDESGPIVMGLRCPDARPEVLGLCVGKVQ